MRIRTTKLHRPVLGLTLAVIVVAASPLSAATSQSTGTKASKHENIGIATGFTVGAVAGGPVGAILGASAGALLGDRFHRQSVARASLEADLSRSRAERSKLETDLLRTQARGEQLGQALDRTRDLETAVGFRTGAATLSEDDVARVQKLGSLAGALGDVKIRVSGYADPRGSEELNTALSQRRANAVAEALAETGVELGRIVVEAHGEADSKSAQGDLDGYAFERRVTVRIEAASGDAAVVRN